MTSMHKYPVWGISKWREFEQCPRMYHAKNVAKRWRDTPNDAMVRGKQMHKALEDAIKYDLALPDELKHMDQLIEGLKVMRSQGMAVYPEMKFGVDIGFKRVDFFDGENLRVRCVLDLFVQDKDRLFLGDWKTGKKKEEHEEDAKFYASLTYLAFEAHDATMAYYYLDDIKASFSIDVNKAYEVAANWWKKFDYADKLVASDNIPATTCNACKWCGDWTCPHNKNDKIK